MLKLRIHCGAYSSTWTDYLELYNLLHSDLFGATHSRTIDALLGTLPYQITHWQRRIGVNNLHLSEILSACSSSICQDPRDKLFTLLGLFGARKHGGLISEQTTTSLCFMYIEIWSIFNMTDSPTAVFSAKNNVSQI